MPAAKSPEFRSRALDPCAEGVPVAQVAMHMGISESYLRRWMERDNVDADRKEVVTSTERTELVELHRRNRVLEEEIEIL